MKVEHGAGDRRVLVEREAQGWGTLVKHVAQSGGWGGWRLRHIWWRAGESVGCVARGWWSLRLGFVVAVELELKVFQSCRQRENTGDKQ